MPDRSFDEDLLDALKFLESLETNLHREELEECARITEPPKLCESIRAGILGAFAEVVHAIHETMKEISANESQQ